MVNKPLGLRPQAMEFKRAHLFDVNPVGVGAMAAATLVSSLAFYGLFGELLKALSPFVALVVAFASAPAIAYVTKGRYYIARESRVDWQSQSVVECCICQHPFEPEDMAQCPAYAGPTARCAARSMRAAMTCASRMGV